MYFYKAHILFHLDRFEEALEATAEMRGVIIVRSVADKLSPRAGRQLRRTRRHTVCGVQGDQQRSGNTAENFRFRFSVRCSISPITIPENREAWLAGLEKGRHARGLDSAGSIDQARTTGAAMLSISTLRTAMADWLAIARTRAAVPLRSIRVMCSPYPPRLSITQVKSCVETDHSPSGDQGHRSSVATGVRRFQRLSLPITATNGVPSRISGFEVPQDENPLFHRQGHADHGGYRDGRASQQQRTEYSHRWHRRGH